MKGVYKCRTTFIYLETVNPSFRAESYKNDSYGHDSYYIWYYTIPQHICLFCIELCLKTLNKGYLRFQLNIAHHYKIEHLRTTCKLTFYSVIKKYCEFFQYQ